VSIIYCCTYCFIKCAWIDKKKNLKIDFMIRLCNVLSISLCKFIKEHWKYGNIKIRNLFCHDNRVLFLCSYKASVSCYYSFSFLLCLNYIYAIVYNCIYIVILHRRRETTEIIETTTMTMMTMTPSSTETARSISDFFFRDLESSFWHVQEPIKICLLYIWLSDDATSNKKSRQYFVLNDIRINHVI